MSFSETEINPQALHFIPLGGVGEIGMNASLYGTEGKWLLVDLGITFTQSITIYFRHHVYRCSYVFQGHLTLIQDQDHLTLIQDHLL